MCDKKNLLHPNQYGAVPGKNSVTPTILEELQYEISRASKRPLIHNDYDASACYDRIIMNMAGLIARGHGQHRSIVFINGKTLQEAKYVLKTQLGVSERSYQHCELFPIYGSGQGAGNSPGIWCCISSDAFKCYEAKANGATFYSPDLSVQCKVFMIGFVDDTSSSTNDFLQPNQKPLDHYAASATDDDQRWNDVLHVTGAALKEIKCSYHFLTYEFTLSGIAYAKGDIFDPVISIKYNSNSQANNLKQFSNYRPHKTLGTC